MKIYDLVVIGSGPAGAFAAKTISSKGMSTLVIEKGSNLNRRRDLVSGWFGQGLFVMDKLKTEDMVLNNNKSINEVFKIIQQVSRQQISIDSKKYCYLSNCVIKELALYFFESISRHADIMFNTTVKKIIKEGDLFKIITSKEEIIARRCLISTGNNSIEWIKSVCEFFDLKLKNRKIKIGVRIEVPTFRIKNIIEERGEDLNIKYNNLTCEDIRINSFVGEWEESNILSAFGYNIPDKSSKKTNFMVGCSIDDTFDAIRNIKIINVLSNDKIKKERIDDFIHGRSVLQHFKMFSNLREIFEKLEEILPYITQYATMYVPEVKLSGILPVDDNMKTPINKLYGAGECTSKVSTLIGAMASGLIVAKTILKE